MEDWKTHASKARLLLASAKHGDRETILARVAAGKDVNTMRRAIFALNFLEGFTKSSPRLSAGLKDASLSAVEVLARWHSFDVAGASDAVKAFAGGQHTVRSLTAAMNAARKQLTTEKGGGSPEARYRSRIESAAYHAISSLFAEPVVASGIQAKDVVDPPVDFRYYRTFEDGRPPKTIVALIVGPYQNKTLYRKRRFDWCFRALALAWIYDDIVLILPRANEVAVYRDWIVSIRMRAARQRTDRNRGTSQRLPEVHVVHPDSRADRSLRSKAKVSLSKEDEQTLWRT